jgi:hypothetical protein
MLRGLLTKNTEGHLLIFIIAISFFLRIWNINKVPISLFSDELDVGYQAYSIIKTGKDYSGNLFPLVFQSYADYRTPAYIYSSNPTVAIFGISPMGVRLPAVIFGVLDVWIIYLLSNQLIKKKIGMCPRLWRIPDSQRNLGFGILPALMLAISPWHIQYSRAAFEVTQLLFFYLLGTYLFFVSLSNPKYFWLSAFSLALTPWVYSTAKLFTPILILFLFIVWYKDIIKFPKIEIIKSVVVFLIIGVPMIYVTFLGRGSQRFNYISVFTDPTSDTQSGYERLFDAQVRQKNGGGIISKVSSRLIHNKYTFWGSKFINNYYQTFSAEFLFISGDPNLRHSIEGMGQFYKVELFALVFGSVLLCLSKENKKIKILIAFWILIGVIPASITRDGGNHATRLIIILPPLIFLISYGIAEIGKILLFGRKYILLVVYFLLLALNFYTYQHIYWVHNPWYSERSWHAGYKEAIDAVKGEESEYNKIILSNSNDDPKIFLAAYYPYPPAVWQLGSGIEYVPGFGELPHYGKYYFGQVDGEIGLMNVSEIMENRTLYVATQSEIKDNLVMKPEKIPQGLKLTKTITYPSGEPAFYLFAKSDSK